MERKIGEIFEFGGEWYQCVECDSCGKCSLRTTECGSSTKSDLADEVFGECSKIRRSDSKHAIFKKLEKVGEPIIVIGRTFQKFTNSDSCVGCVFCNENNGCDKCCYMDESCLDNEIWIEIKQNKEDMEEKEQCGDNRFEVIEKAKKHLLSSTNIESSKEEMKVLDNFLIRCWQMGWLDKYNDTKHSNSENIGKNLKEFDINLAKQGKPVCTRDGRKARIVCFDAKFPKTGNIVTLVEKENGEEVTLYHYDDGHCSIGRGYDLMMLPEKKEGWMNVYYDRISGITFSKHPYPSKEEAIKNAGTMSNRTDTVKISWEE